MPGLGWPAVPGVAVAALPDLPEVLRVPNARGVQPKRAQGSLGVCGSVLMVLYSQ